MNSSEALAAVFELVHEINKKLEEGITKEEKETILGFMEKFDSIFDVLKVGGQGKIDEKWLQQKIEERNKAREEKDWAKADQVRDELMKKGIELLDSAEGTQWKIKT